MVAHFCRWSSSVLFGLVREEKLSANKCYLEVPPFTPNLGLSLTVYISQHRNLVTLVKPLSQMSGATLILYISTF